MALLVFLRGMNVGGHRTLRPSVLARELRAYDVISIGAAGTFIVRKPGRRAHFLGELRRRLPHKAIVSCCAGRDLVRLASDRPFGNEPPHEGLVQFVSVLSKASRKGVSCPATIPDTGEWFVRIVGSKGRLVFGVYRRHMKTIGHLDRIDDLFGAAATTRSWSTMLAILRELDPDTPAEG